MFPRLAEHYKSVVQDLVMSLQALTKSLKSTGTNATCYSCGDGRDGHGASFVAEIGEGHMVRFLVSDFGISWVESEMDGSSSSWKEQRPSMSSNEWPTWCK